MLIPTLLLTQVARPIPGSAALKPNGEEHQRNPYLRAGVTADSGPLTAESRLLLGRRSGHHDATTASERDWREEKSEPRSAAEDPPSRRARPSPGEQAHRVP